MSVQHGTYVAGLDGLRAIAVGSVLYAHLFPWAVGVRPPFQFGFFGVTLFFVISGFLIGSILLRYKDALETGESTLGRSLVTFHGRRALRIFPIYYLTVLVFGVVLQNEDLMGPFSRSWPWWPTFSMNIGYPYFGVPWGSASHVWSLCVEEQFYLLAPALIFLLPRRMMPPLLLVLLFAAVFARWYPGIDVGFEHTFRTRSLWESCDGLIIGVLLAYTPQAHLPRVAHILSAIAAPALVIELMTSVGNSVAARNAEYSLGSFAVALIAGAMVATVATSSSAARALEWRPLRYIGRISYGIYLYHLFVAPFVLPLSRSWGAALGLERSGPLYSVLAVGLTVLIASLSFHLIERPLLNLKRFLPAPGDGRRDLPDSAVSARATVSAL